MSQQASPQSPLSIYVLFHRESHEGRELAASLHDWFRCKTDDGSHSEAGLPIWFRICVSTDKTRFSPEIKWEQAEHNILVVLADRHMVADENWRHALAEVCKLQQSAQRSDEGRILILPIELHRSLYNLGFLTAERNSLRIGDSKDGIVQRSRNLRRATTEALARELATNWQKSDTPERLSVFLSHAKRDGLAVAEQLRDSLASIGQLRVWFDATDCHTAANGPSRFRNRQRISPRWSA